MKLDIQHHGVVTENGRFEATRTVARVHLSRRNLLALLTKLDMDGSACTIFTDYDTPDGVRLVVTAEDDDEHYADRVPPGPMHPQTEADIAS